MITNMKKLRGKIVEAGTTHEAIADAIGIDRSTFYRKIKSEGLSFSIAEMHSLVKELDLTQEEAIEIFLNK